MPTPEPNAYSPAWHAAFGAAVPDDTTEREVAFLQRLLPLPEYARVLDVCCGYGRHAHALARLGHDVTGVDRDAAVVEEARRRGGAPTFVQLDVRDLDRLAGRYDAALSLWASFGWFGDAEDERVLAATAAKLRDGGRVVLDVFAPSFHVRRAGVRELRPGVRETKRVRDRTLELELEYDAGGADAFAFQLYDVHELAAMGARHGLELVVACTRYDESVPPNDDEPRMQLVFERR